jgi:hypothetical protein
MCPGDAVNYSGFRSRAMTESDMEYVANAYGGKTAEEAYRSVHP